jgi:hypothetical protein
MAITAAYEQTALSVSSTELSLTGGTSSIQAQTAAGVYQLVVDGVTNMAKGDVFEIRVLEKTLASGTQRAIFTARLNDAQSELFVIPSIILLNGWDFTIKKIAGTDRAFDTSVRKVA